MSNIASWTLTAQLQTGTLNVGTSDHVWWNGAAFGDNIVIGDYQDSTHVADGSDNQLDTISPVNNTKYVDATHVSINGGGSSALPIATGSCGLLFNFSDPSSVQTSGAKVYVYDGVEDINAMEDITFYAAEGGQSTSWVNANGLNSALVLQDQVASTSHNFYIATSLSPQTSGLKSGKLKIVLSYV